MIKATRMSLVGLIKLDQGDKDVAGRCGYGNEEGGGVANIPSRLVLRFVGCC